MNKLIHLESNGFHAFGADMAEAREEMARRVRQWAVEHGEDEVEAFVRNYVDGAEICED